MKRFLVLLALVLAGAASAQSVDPTPSRATLEEASRDDCEGVSVVVRRCAKPPPATKATGREDALTRSRAAAKASFDRRARRARDEALAGGARTGSSDGAAERLAPVTVTGRADDTPPSVEEVLQRALAPVEASPTGTVMRYGPDGTRSECISGCRGPMCCLTTRERPNPARESNSIGR